MAEKIRFYMDEHVPSAVTKGLRVRGVDVLTAQDVSMLEIEDHNHLAFAVEQNRVTFTQDADFLRLHAKGVDHAGIVYVPQQTPIGYIVRGLMLIYQVLEPEEMQNHVEFL